MISQGTSKLKFLWKYKSYFLERSHHSVSYWIQAYLLFENFISLACQSLCAGKSHEKFKWSNELTLLFPTFLCWIGVKTRRMANLDCLTHFFCFLRRLCLDVVPTSEWKLKWFYNWNFGLVGRYCHKICFPNSLLGHFVLWKMEIVKGKNYCAFIPFFLLNPISKCLFRYASG